MNYPPVVILLLNYNRHEDTVDSVRSLKACTYPSLSIVVIDNGSTDQSARQLQEKLPGTPVLETGRNLGYTGGINAGLRHVTGKGFAYALLLNNDTVVEPDFLEKLVEPLEKNDRAAAASGTIFCHHDRNLVWYAGGRMVPWRGLAVHESKGLRIKRSDLNRVREVSFVTGCMILLRASALERVGLEDERFFMYLDDIELSLRISQRGYTMLYVPQSVIYHKVLGEKESAFKLYYSVRNRLLLIRSLAGIVQRSIAAAYFLVVISIKLLYWRFRNPRFFRAAWWGLADSIRGRFGEGRGALFAEP